MQDIGGFKSQGLFEISHIFYHFRTRSSFSSLVINADLLTCCDFEHATAPDTCLEAGKELRNMLDSDSRADDKLLGRKLFNFLMSGNLVNVRRVGCWGLLLQSIEEYNVKNLQFLLQIPDWLSNQINDLAEPHWLEFLLDDGGLHLLLLRECLMCPLGSFALFSKAYDNVTNYVKQLKSSQSFISEIFSASSDVEVVDGLLGPSVKFVDGRYLIRSGVQVLSLFFRSILCIPEGSSRKRVELAIFALRKLACTQDFDVDKVELQSLVLRNEPDRQGSPLTMALKCMRPSVLAELMDLCGTMREPSVPILFKGQPLRAIVEHLAIPCEISAKIDDDISKLSVEGPGTSWLIHFEHSRSLERVEVLISSGIDIPFGASIVVSVKISTRQTPLKPQSAQVVLNSSKKKARLTTLCIGDEVNFQFKLESVTSSGSGTTTRDYVGDAIEILKLYMARTSPSSAEFILNEEIDRHTPWSLGIHRGLDPDVLVHVVPTHLVKSVKLALSRKPLHLLELKTLIDLMAKKEMSGLSIDITPLIGKPDFRSHTRQMDPSSILSAICELGCEPEFLHQAYKKATLLRDESSLAVLFEHLPASNEETQADDWSELYESVDDAGATEPNLVNKESSDLLVAHVQPTDRMQRVLDILKIVDSLPSRTFHLVPSVNVSLDELESVENLETHSAITSQNDTSADQPEIQGNKTEMACLLSAFPDDLKHSDKLKCHWDLRFTRDFKRDLAGLQSQPKLIRSLLDNLKALASGQKGRTLMRLLKGTPKFLRIFESPCKTFHEESRFLWQYAVDYSPTIQKYSETIRLWKICLKHKDIPRAVKNIIDSHRKGRTCNIRKHLVADKATPQEDGVRMPRIYSLLRTDVFQLVDERHDQEAFELLAESDEEDEKLDSESVVFTPPAVVSAESFNILKFYALADEVVNCVENSIEGENLVDLNKLEFPMVPDELEDRLIQLNLTSSFRNPPLPPAGLSSILLVGRSGTGKTSIAVGRIWAFYKRWHKLFKQPVQVGESTKPFHYHQIFVTANAILRDQVRRSFLGLKQGLQSSYAANPSCYPPTLHDVPEDVFPMFLTQMDWLKMLDGTLEDPFFPRNADGSVQAHIRSGFHEEAGMLLEIPTLDDKGDQRLGCSEEHPTAPDGNDSSEQTTLNERLSRGQRKIEIDFRIFRDDIWPKIVSSRPTETKKLSPSSLFQEIHSYIKGSSEALNTSSGFLSREQYLGLPSKMAPNFQGSKHVDDVPGDRHGHRDLIYDLLEKYQGEKRRINGYDNSDLVFHIWTRLCKQSYNGTPIHSMFIDEVQDFTPAELKLFLHICKDKNDLFLSGDTCQTIANGVGFRFQDLRSLFKEQQDIQSLQDLKEYFHPVVVPPVEVLLINYRTHSGILTAANAIVDLLKKYFWQSIDVLNAETGFFSGPKPLMVVETEMDVATILIVGSDKRKSQIEFGAHQVILVRNQAAKKSLPSQLDGCLAMTVVESKGLEFDDVFLWNFFGDSRAKFEWRLVLNYLMDMDDSTQSAEETALRAVRESEQSNEIKGMLRPLTEFNRHAMLLLCEELKHLYTAITRARMRIVIIDQDPVRRAPMYHFLRRRDLVQVISVLDEDYAHPHRAMAVSTSQHEWRARGHNLKESCIYQLAAQCFHHSGDTLLEMEMNGFYAADQAKSAASPSKEVLFFDAGEFFVKAGNMKMAARHFCDAQEFDLAAKTALKCIDIEDDRNLRESCILFACSCFLKAKKMTEAVDTYVNNGLIRDALHLLLNEKDHQSALRALQILEQNPHFKPPAELEKNIFLIKAASSHPWAKSVCKTKSESLLSQKADFLEILRQLQPDDEINFLYRFLDDLEAEDMIPRFTFHSRIYDAVNVLEGKGRIHEAICLLLPVTSGALPPGEEELLTAADICFGAAQSAEGGPNLELLVEARHHLMRSSQAPANQIFLLQVQLEIVKLQASELTIEGELRKLEETARNTKAHRFIELLVMYYLICHNSTRTSRRQLSLKDHDLILEAKKSMKTIASVLSKQNVQAQVFAEAEFFYGVSREDGQLRVWRGRKIALDMFSGVQLLKSRCETSRRAMMSVVGFQRALRYGFMRMWRDFGLKLLNDLLLVQVPDKTPTISELTRTLSRMQVVDEGIELGNKIEHNRDLQAKYRLDFNSDASTKAYLDVERLVTPRVWWYISRPKLGKITDRWKVLQIAVKHVISMDWAGQESDQKVSDLLRRVSLLDMLADCKEVSNALQQHKVRRQITSTESDDFLDVLLNIYTSREHDNKAIHIATFLQYLDAIFPFQSDSETKVTSPTPHALNFLQSAIVESLFLLVVNYCSESQMGPGQTCVQCGMIIVTRSCANMLNDGGEKQRFLKIGTASEPWNVLMWAMTLIARLPLSHTGNQVWSSSVSSVRWLVRAVLCTLMSVLGSIGCDGKENSLDSERVTEFLSGLEKICMATKLLDVELPPGAMLTAAALELPPTSMARLMKQLNVDDHLVAISVERHTVKGQPSVLRLSLREEGIEKRHDQHFPSGRSLFVKSRAWSILDQCPALSVMRSRLQSGVAMLATVLNRRFLPISASISRGLVIAEHPEIPPNAGSELAMSSRSPDLDPLRRSERYTKAGFLVIDIECQFDREVLLPEWLRSTVLAMVERRREGVSEATWEDIEDGLSGPSKFLYNMSTKALVLDDRDAKAFDAVIARLSQFRVMYESTVAPVLVRLDLSAQRLGDLKAMMSLRGGLQGVQPQSADNELAAGELDVEVDACLARVEESAARLSARLDAADTAQWQELGCDWFPFLRAALKEAEETVLPRADTLLKRGSATADVRSIATAQGLPGTLPAGATDSTVGLSSPYCEGAVDTDGGDSGGGGSGNAPLRWADVVRQKPRAIRRFGPDGPPADDSEAAAAGGRGGRKT